MKIYTVIIGQPARDFTEDIIVKAFTNKEEAMEYYTEKKVLAISLFLDGNLIETEEKDNKFSIWRSYRWSTAHITIELREIEVN